MLEVEIQKLTAAVEALTVQLKSMHTNTEAEAEKPSKKPSPRAGKVSETVADAPEPSETSEAPDAPDAVSSVSKENLKEIALEISRTDPSAKKEIVSILASHKSKTISELPEDQAVLFDVFTRLNNVIHKIARDGE